MTRYAATTTVSSEKTRLEVERTLRKYGADQFAYGWDDHADRAMIGFRVTGRQIRIELPMPSSTEKRITHTQTGLKRSEGSRQEMYEQAIRQRWRALLLVIKAKLEAIDSGISTIEKEFLADVVLPDGRTLGEYVAPQLERAYAENRMPQLLPGPSS